MIPDVKPVSVTLPNGERLEAKEISARVQSMFMEIMIKSMEESVSAEDGLFGNSSSSEIYRGMLREQLAASMSQQLRTPFQSQLEQGIRSQQPAPAGAPAVNSPHNEAPESVDSAIPVSGRVTSPVGWRRDPINGSLRFHRGTDIAAAYGTEVRAVAEGVVVESGARGGYGNTVVIQTGDGRRMLYAHNHANLVQVGARIQKGEVIAQVGASGRATGPHVHFEVMEQ